MAWFEVAWPRLNWLGLVRTGLAWCKLAWPCTKAWPSLARHTQCDNEVSRSRSVSRPGRVIGPYTRVCHPHGKNKKWENPIFQCQCPWKCQPQNCRYPHWIEALRSKRTSLELDETSTPDTSLLLSLSVWFAVLMHHLGGIMSWPNQIKLL